MVTCHKCGTVNQEDAKFCVNCGISLQHAKRNKKREDTCFGPSEQRVEDECFGLPFGKELIGLVAGVFIILMGISIIFEFNLGRWTGVFILLLVGTLIITSVLYSFLKQKN